MTDLVVVTGAPRSGTSLCVDILAYCGAWTGVCNRLKENVSIREQLAHKWKVDGIPVNSPFVGGTTDIDATIVQGIADSLISQPGYRDSDVAVVKHPWFLYAPAVTCGLRPAQIILTKRNLGITLDRCKASFLNKTWKMDDWDYDRESKWIKHNALARKHLLRRARTLQVPVTIADTGSILDHSCCINSLRYLPRAVGLASCDLSPLYRRQGS